MDLKIPALGNTLGLAGNGQEEEVIVGGDEAVEEEDNAEEVEEAEEDVEEEDEVGTVILITGDATAAPLQTIEPALNGSYLIMGTGAVSVTATLTEEIAE